MADIYQTVMGVLASPSARKIDFHLGLIHVDAAGLAAIQFQITLGRGVGGGVQIKVDASLKPDVAAQYNNTTNTLVFPRADYGATVVEKATILHECVHALHDVYGGGYYHPRGGSRFMAESENEAAAYVADALYYLYETGKVQRGGTHIYYAGEIAKRIMNQRGAFVSTAEATDLRIAIVNSKTYKIGFSTPTKANGL